MSQTGFHGFIKSQFRNTPFYNFVGHRFEVSALNIFIIYKTSALIKSYKPNPASSKRLDTRSNKSVRSFDNLTSNFTESPSKHMRFKVILVLSRGIVCVASRRHAGAHFRTPGLITASVCGDLPPHTGRAFKSQCRKSTSLRNNRLQRPKTTACTVTKPCLWVLP